MGPRRKWLPWLACATIAAVGFPGLAHGDAQSEAAAVVPPSTGSVIAFDTGFRDGSQADPADNLVELAAGGTVTFSYPTGGLSHNVDFGSGPQPTTCTQTAGPLVGAAPPLPKYLLTAGWAGTCTFDVAGTYSFVCQAHSAMTGSIVVKDAGTPTPTATATPTPTPTATPTATPSATPVAAASVTAHDTPPTASEPARNWYENGQVSIAPGETVHFSYPDGSSAHNVDFAGNAAQPTCTQTTAAIPGTTAPPLPPFAMPKGWTGDCTFDAPGVYTFFCDAHKSEMTGTVRVGTTPQPTVTVIPEPVRDGTPAGKPKAWASLNAPAPKATSVAGLLSGELKLTAQCASVDRGTVTVTVTKAVARRLHMKGTTLATGSARCNGNGRFTAQLKPTAAARRALKRYRKAVAVTATLRLTSATGKVTTSRKLTLKGGA